jgi:hypothetical protein
MQAVSLMLSQRLVARSSPLASQSFPALAQIYECALPSLEGSDEELRPAPSFNQGCCRHF